MTFSEMKVSKLLANSDRGPASSPNLRAADLGSLRVADPEGGVVFGLSFPTAECFLNRSPKCKPGRIQNVDGSRVSLKNPLAGAGDGIGHAAAPFNGQRAGVCTSVPPAEFTRSK